MIESHKITLIKLLLLLFLLMNCCSGLLKSKSNRKMKQQMTLKDFNYQFNDKGLILICFMFGVKYFLFRTTEGAQWWRRNNRQRIQVWCLQGEKEEPGEIWSHWISCWWGGVQTVGGWDWSGESGGWWWRCEVVCVHQQESGAQEQHCPHDPWQWSGQGWSVGSQTHHQRGEEYKIFVILNFF